MLGWVQVVLERNVWRDINNRLVVWCGVCCRIWFLPSAVLVALVPQIAARLNEQSRGGIECFEGIQEVDSIAG